MAVSRRRAYTNISDAIASFLRSGYRAGTQHIVEGSELKFISRELMGVCKPDWYWIEKMPVQMER